MRWLAAFALAVAMAACSADRSGPAGGGGPPCIPAGSPARSAPAPLARLALACLSSGGPVRLGELGRPAVVNLWASWCEPCRKELPAIERYARQAGGSVLVVGVATETGRGVARDIVTELDLTFPNLYDPDRSLLRAIGRTALPATVFVAADGAVAYVYNGAALDTAGVAQLATQYLNVAVK